MNNEQSLGFIIAKTHTKMKNNLAKALKPFHVTPEQWALLNSLWEQDGIPQKELSQKSFKDQPTTTRILDKLAQRGLIHRQVDPDDRRAFLIYLTTEGQNIREPLTDLARQALARALEGLSGPEQALLKDLLNRISDNLDSGGHACSKR
ncbi:MAG TPA: MarR family transcriptional regulator [Syntrophomonadaceae bacterium]|nr:MarR family transcriptional regulator [Syntrophomonadaceae bacterium]